jgi:hypothetical protein
MFSILGTLVTENDREISTKYLFWKFIFYLRRLYALIVRASKAFLNILEKRKIKK